MFKMRLLKLNSVKKKMIVGFTLLTLLNVLIFLGYELFNANTRLTNEALDKSYVYAEHIEKILSPIGVEQPEKLQSKITELLETDYERVGYIGVLDKNFKYIAHTDNSKIGSDFKIAETEEVLNSNISVSQSFIIDGREEYLSIVPFYTIQGYNDVEATSSATTKIDIPGLVIVSMDTNLMLKEQKAGFLKILLIGIILLILSIIVAILIAATITNPLKDLRGHLHKIADGDLTSIVRVKSKDELRDLSNDLNTTILFLKNIISDIKSTTIFLDKYSGELNVSTEKLSVVSEEVSASMYHVAQNSSVQSERLSNSVSTINVFSKNLDDINFETKKIEDSSILIKEVADIGMIKINKLILSMKDAQDSFQSVNEKIVFLSNSITQINEITESINSIAKQTNLLSLNASIEASRAGAAGTGFAVVADEIRNLADKTLASSRNISLIINEVINNTAIVTTTASDAINTVKLQSSTIEDTVSVFNNIVGQVTAIIPKINEVAKTLKQTIVMKDNILSDIDSISLISDGIATSCEDVSSAIQEQTATTTDLYSLSGQLNETSKKLVAGIDKFKL